MHAVTCRQTPLHLLINAIEDMDMYVQHTGQLVGQLNEGESVAGHVPLLLCKQKGKEAPQAVLQRPGSRCGCHGQLWPSACTGQLSCNFCAHTNANTHAYMFQSLLHYAARRICGQDIMPTLLQLFPHLECVVWSKRYVCNCGWNWVG